MCVSSGPPPRKPVEEWSLIWTKIIGPIVLCVVGCFGFIYSLLLGHDATFGSLSLGLAAAGAGLSADILRKAA